MRYTIGQFAQQTGVSAKTLRYYDEIGLLRPAWVDPRTRYRCYLPSQFSQLASILALKEIGFSLEEIRTLLSRKLSQEDRRALLSGARERARRSIEIALRSMQMIDATLGNPNDGPLSIPVLVKNWSPVRVASIRAQVKTYEEILNVERELFASLPSEALGGLRGVLWHRCADSGVLEGEPFVEVSQQLIRARNGIYRVRELPSVTVASAYSRNEDDAEPAYDALRRWMPRRGYRLAGAKREIYLGDTLEIQFPIAAD